MVNISPAAQFFNIVLVVVIVYLEIKQAQCQRKFWRWTVPVLALMFHMAFYYAFYFYDRFISVSHHPIEFYTFWSSVLRTHSLATFLILSLARLLLMRGHTDND